MHNGYPRDSSSELRYKSGTSRKLALEEQLSEYFATRDAFKEDRETKCLVAKLGLQEYFLKDVPNILQLRCKKFLLRTHCSSNWTDLGGAKCQNDMMLLCAESSRKGTRIDLRTFLKVFTCCAKMI